MLKADLGRAGGSAYPRRGCKLPCFLHWPVCWICTT